MAGSSVTSHEVALRTLQDILLDFNIPLPTSEKGPTISFIGGIPPVSETKSEKINLSLIGTIPALANAVTAAQIWEARGGKRQCVESDLRRGHNYIDPDIGMTPSLNGQEIPLDMVAGNPFLFNIFETRDGRSVVLSAVYVDLVYRWSAFLGCSVAESAVRNAVRKWNSEELEVAAAAAGMPMAICQTEESWSSHPQGSHLAQLPWVPTEPAKSLQPITENIPWSYLPDSCHRPLSGIKVLCLTHAIAGPSAGRTLAEHGASVLQIMFTHGFEHPFVYTYANLGTASSRLNLHRGSDVSRLRDLVGQAHVWIDSYRANAISKFGFGEEDLRRINPGLIVCRTRCYGTTGPWASKPGFDMQGSASSGMMAVMGEGEEDAKPRWPPGMVINDYTTGYATALAVQSVLLKRFTGKTDPAIGWNISPSLCGTAMGILKYFKTSRFGAVQDSGSRALPPEMLQGQTNLGYLKTLAPLPKMSLTPLAYELCILQTIGSSRPVFPGFDDGYDVLALDPMRKDEVAESFVKGSKDKIERLLHLGQQARAKFET
ncbi:CoA-transferase family III [Pseudovirgaria hyperparasitica]|uniref:CoA-transferase family III n=1 Tax=Pseudovirgaria hyperparasitica TaxID=470096 RepID=A0A6A6WIT2_9PEZI|nr:CoA-transferase family III [Pseudovirgaria hyperparasitica]KAF2762065.1 CoA-transferase family III [Pseudovirgaria hyperparasitica]